MVWLEQSRSPADLVGVVESLRGWWRSAHDDELMRVFAEWVRRLMTRFMPEEEEALPPVLTPAPRELLKHFRVFPTDEVLASHCGKLRFGAMPGCTYAVTPKGADKPLSLFDEVGNYDNRDAVVLRHATSETLERR